MVRWPCSNHAATDIVPSIVTSDRIVDSRYSAEGRASHFGSNVTERMYPNFPGIAPISAFFAGKFTPGTATSRNVTQACGHVPCRRCPGCGTMR